MKFVALISGGKDSFFNIHHCLSQGHELIALANLYPEDVDRQEIDSFMFQTVGHDLVQNYSQCLDVPLYRQPITGKSSNRKLEYTPTAKDEIEDLFQLLLTVKHHHPNIEAVSSGAILSHYQRTRVENVCDRLGLTSLAYLWQRNQQELMMEMCSHRLDARLIKVAAIGLNQDHLGKSLAQVFPQLVKLNKLYDVHVCGEGGEFESMVMDLPIFNLKKMVITDEQIYGDSSDNVYNLRCKVELVDKEQEVFVPIEAPSLLTPEFQDIQDLVKSEKEVEASSHPVVSGAFDSCVTGNDGTYYISDLTASGSTIEEQTVGVFSQLEAILTQHTLTFDNIQHVTLLLSDIGEFDKINRIYSGHFKYLGLPPLRICVQTTLFENCRIQLSCIANQGEKQGIYIRSRSYWAPQNIGPYSQSVSVAKEGCKIATLSGQIPLIPSTMQIDNSSDINGVLSLQHLHRVKTLVGAKQIGYVICFVTNESMVSTVRQIWENYCEDIESSSWKERLIVVEVTDLPKHANVEWGGMSFSPDNLLNYDDDEEVPELSEEDHQLFSGFEKFTVVDVGKQKVVILATNDVEKAQLVKHHATVISPLGLVKGREHLPVVKSWDYTGTEYKVQLIVRINR